MLRHVACVITAPPLENGHQTPPKGSKRTAGYLAAVPAKRECNLLSSAADEWKVVRRAGEVTDLRSGGGRGVNGVFPGEAADSGKKPSELSLALRQSWSSDTGRCVDASPALLVHRQTGRTTVFIGSHSHRFQALDLSSGTCLWERVLGNRIESSAAVSLCASLVVVGQCRLFGGDSPFAFLVCDWSSEDLVFICFHIFARLLRRPCVFPVHNIWKDPVDVSDRRCSEELSSCGSSHWSGERGVT